MCNLNFREFIENFDQQVAIVRSTVNKLVYDQGIALDQLAKMPIQQIIQLLDDLDMPLMNSNEIRFASMIKQFAGQEGQVINRPTIPMGEPKTDDILGRM